SSALSGLQSLLYRSRTRVVAPRNVDESAARKAVYNEIRHPAILKQLLWPNRHREVDQYSGPRRRQLGCAGRAKLLPKLGEGRLHLVISILASTHPFVFGAQKSFIDFLGLATGQIRSRVDVARLNNIHGGFECTRR